MITMKTLCLYYTRTNTTKTAMEQLAKLLDADLAEYTDGKDRSGILGYIGACFCIRKESGIPNQYQRGYPVYKVSSKNVQKLLFNNVQLF